MKVEKRILDSIEADSDFGRIIACAMYLNEKAKKHEVGGTVTEQVALLTIKGNEEKKVAQKTGFNLQTVKTELENIIAFCVIEKGVTA